MVDFADVKARVPITDAATYLNLTLKGGRSPCPACQAGGDRALVITPAKNVFYCHHARKGGDCISLVAHIREIGMRDAALELEAHFLSTVPNKAVRGEPTPPKQPTAPLERIAERLQHDHPAVLALGLDADTAQELGIGFDSRGMMKGRVCIPLWRDGALAGFCGLGEDGLKFPPNLLSVPTADDTNVVRLTRRKA